MTMGLGFGVLGVLGFLPVVLRGLRILGVF